MSIKSYLPVIGYHNRRFMNPSKSLHKPRHKQNLVRSRMRYGGHDVITNLSPDVAPFRFTADAKSSKALYLIGFAP
jgi:hypothetical protein